MHLSGAQDLLKRRTRFPHECMAFAESANQYGLTVLLGPDMDVATSQDAF